MGSYGIRIQCKSGASDGKHFERLQRDKENAHKVLKFIFYEDAAMDGVY